MEATTEEDSLATIDEFYEVEINDPKGRLNHIRDDPKVEEFFQEIKDDLNNQQEEQEIQPEQKQEEQQPTIEKQTMGNRPFQN